MSCCRFCGADADASVIGRIEIRLPLEPVSQNAISAKGNRVGGIMARKKYKAQRDTYRLLLRAEAKANGLPSATTRRRVTFWRLYGPRGRRYDHANLVGGMKPLVDAMVEEGWLVDDAEEWMEGHYRQRQDGDGGVEIIVEALGRLG